ncbi:MAG: hypothetical protein PUK10_00670, partial [Clostridium sp.]|nr:hypothetical protein [Clostridium sp.]
AARQAYCCLVSVTFSILLYKKIDMARYLPFRAGIVIHIRLKMKTDGVTPPAGYENKTKCGRKIPEKSLSDNILPYAFAKVKTFDKNNYI